MHAAIPGGLAALLLLTSCRSSVWVQREVTLEVPLAVVTRIDLDIETKNGRVSIEELPGSQRASIVADFRASGRTRILAEQRAQDFSIEHAFDGQGRLRIRPVPPDRWRSGDQASIRIVVPDAGTARVVTSNGRITVEGLEGASMLRTSNGAVTTRATHGQLEISTSNGAIRIEDHFGPAYADTSNGSITVVLASDSSDEFDVETSNGAIRIAVGPNWQGLIRGSTSNGSVRHYEQGSLVSKSSSDLRVQVGDDATASRLPASRASTSNGSVKIEVE